MKIHVSTTFLGPLTQNTFFVKTTDEQETKEYRGVYEAGEWEFQLYAEDKLILESRRIKLSGGKTFLGHRRYKILWEGREIGVVNRSYFRKELIFDGESHPFPRLFNCSVEGLDLKFPLSAWVYRRKVTSECTSAEETRGMLAIATTIFVWFTWNALPAD